MDDDIIKPKNKNTVLIKQEKSTNPELHNITNNNSGNSAAKNLTKFVKDDIITETLFEIISDDLIDFTTNFINIPKLIANYDYIDELIAAIASNLMYDNIHYNFIANSYRNSSPNLEHDFLRVIDSIVAYNASYYFEKPLILMAYPTMSFIDTNIYSKEPVSALLMTLFITSYKEIRELIDNFCQEVQKKYLIQPNIACVSPLIDLTDPEEESWEAEIPLIPALSREDLLNDIYE